MSKRVIEVRELRQVAFPDFPVYHRECRAQATDERENFEWDCNRQPGHEGPHMSTFEYDGEGTIIGFAWIEEEN